MTNWWEEDRQVISAGRRDWWNNDDEVPNDDLFRIADTNHKLKHARKSLSGSLIPDLFSTMTQVTFRTTSIGQRLAGGLVGDPDESNRIADAFAQASAEMDRQRFGDSVISKVAGGVRGAAVTAPATMVGGAIGGPVGAIGAAVISEGNVAITEGRDAGLEGAGLAAYAGSQAAIEGAVAGTMQKIGLGGLEGMFGKNATKIVGSGVVAGIKRAGLSTVSEVGEEVLTEVGHSVADVVAKVDEGALEPDRLLDTITDTTIQTLITMGAFNASKATLDKAHMRQLEKYEKQKDDIIDLADSGDTPTRKQWKEFGLPQELGNSAEDRKTNIKFFAEQIEKIRETAVDRETAPDKQETQAVEEIDKMVPGGKKDQIIAGDGTLAAASAAEAKISATRKIEPPTDPTVTPGPLPPEVAQAQKPQPNITEDGPPGLLKSLFTDEQGRMGINLNAVKNKARRAKEDLGVIARRFLTTRGGLFKGAHELKKRMEGEFSEELAKMGQIGKEYDLAVKAAFGNRIPEGTIDAIDRVLRNEAKIETLPVPLRKPITEMRNHIDFLSAKLIASGAVEGDLAIIIAQNMGSYLHRSFEAIDNKGWADNAGDDKKNAAKAWLRKEYPKWEEGEVQGFINHLLGSKAAESPFHFSQTKLGQKHLGILKKRKNLPKVLLDLLGEYHDPKMNYMKSVAKLADLVTKHQFLSDVRDLGLQGGFFHEGNPIETDKGSLHVELSGDSSSAMYPLNGIYTTQELADAFENVMSHDTAEGFMRVLIQLNGKVKAAKTVFSAQTHVRNALGNVFFAINQGHWDVRKFKQAFSGTMAGLRKMGEREHLDYYNRAVRLGIVGQDTRAGELRDYIQDAATMDPGQFMWDDQARANKFKKAYRKGQKVTTELYQAEDDIWKLFAWENEKARYRKALPDLSESKIEEMTAKIVTDTYPTYANIPEAIRKLRRFPLFGTFVSFPAEIIRTSYNTLDIARREIADERTRNIGYMRAAGVTSNAMLVPAMAAMFRLLSGVTKDEDEALRSFVAPWQTNSTLMHLWKDRKGNYTFIYASYTDPFSMFRNTIDAFWSGKDMKQGVWGGLVEFLEPFVSEDILAEKLLDIKRNQTDDGRQVYNNQDTVSGQYADIISHIGDAFVPGTVISANRILKGATGIQELNGRTYNPWVESAAMLTGQRISPVNVKQSLKYRTHAFKRNITEANKLIGQSMKMAGHIDPADLASEYRKVDGIRRRIYDKMRGTSSDAMKLAIDPSDVAVIMKNNGATKEDIGTVMYGIYVPYAITKDRAEAMYMANPDEFENRLDALMKEQDAIMAELGYE